MRVKVRKRKFVRDEREGKENRTREKKKEKDTRGNYRRGKHT